MTKGPRKRDTILQVARNRIVRGVYTHKLPGDRALARELGVDQKMVEMVVVQLQMLGLVRREHRRGTFVVPFDEASGISPVSARLVHPLPRELSTAGFWDTLIAFGFEQACQEHRVPMVVTHTHTVDEAVMQAVQASRSGRYVGTCLRGFTPETRHAVILRQARTPVVVVDWEFETPIIPSVSFDNREAGALIAKHLVALGHRHIAFLWRMPENPVLSDRLAGVNKVLAAHALPLAQEMDLSDDPQEIVNRVLSASPRPTAVVSHTMAYAQQLLDRAAAAGARVPQDLSVASFHDPRCLEHPEITMAVLDFEALGRRALEALLDEDLWEIPKPRLIPVRRIVGSTAAPPPTTE